MNDDDLRRLEAEIEKTAIAGEKATGVARVESRKGEFVRDIRDLILAVRRSFAQYHKKVAELASVESDELCANVATIEERLAREDQVLELAEVVKVLEWKLKMAKQNLAARKAQA